ncbi:MAG: HTH domain-containing protein [Clostridiales bacterium]|jgi:biotin operon repressor|nr:HTH domain-containing protein [Clostridiales bacterium]
MQDNKSRLGNKKISLLLVLNALEKASDKDNPIKQIHLAKMVNTFGDKLGIDVCCDRKTVGRHLKLLSAVGYDIVTVKGRGYYLESNKFTLQESDALINLIESSTLSKTVKTRLADKILAQRVNVDKKNFLKDIDP